MAILVFLLFVTFQVTNSATIPDCMSTYMTWTGATCLGTTKPCATGQCTFSLARYTYICCVMSTTVTQPVCPATMTPYSGAPLLCKPSDPSAGCPYTASCQLSSVAGTYMCCVGATSGVTTTASPTTSVWTTSGLSPTFVPTPPSTNLIITFQTTSLIIGQNTASPQVVSTSPFPPDSVTGYTTSTAMRYSLLVVDVDAVSNALKYMILNAPGTGTNMQTFAGIPVAPSVAINPATFSGTHRIVALLFQTSTIANPSIPNISTFTIASFIANNAATFGIPVAGTYFTVTGTAGR